MGFFSSISNIIGAVGLATTVAGAFLSFKESKARNASLDGMIAARNKAAGEQRKQNQLRLARERRKTIREARIVRARAVSAATVQGASGSVRGGFGSVVSQASNNLAFLHKSNIFAERGSQFLKEAADFGSLATSQAGNIANFNALSNFGSTIFNKREELSSISRTIFRT